MNNIIHSKKFKFIVAVILSLALLSLVFQAGILVGFHKASFLYKFGDNYYKTFGEKRMPLMMRDERMGGNGVVGKIIRVSPTEIVVLGKDSVEKSILITDKTLIHQFRSATSSSALSINNTIAVIGTSNDQGQIIASFIRILPQ